MAQTSDNSGMGVVLGIVIAVLLAIGGYYFVQSRGGMDNDGNTTVNIEAPATTEPAAGGSTMPEAPTPTPAPAQ